jgi:hypothetical protein
MRYIANPVTVEAKRIAKVMASPDGGRDVLLQLEDNSVFEPSADMLARMTPQPGDYLVTQEDGYVYLNPKDVFERKYRPAVDEGDKRVSA